MTDVLLDTNILLYAALNSKIDSSKREIARDIVLNADYGLSGQVLAEFYANAVKKGASPLSPDQASRWVEILSRKPCQPIDIGVVQSAVAKSRRHKISYWDGAILAAAEKLGCKTVYSEDLTHGRTYGSVRVVNPFLTEPLSEEG